MLDKLVAYYEYLRERYPDKVAAPGWSSTRVSAFLELDPEGNLINVIPSPEPRGLVRHVPRQVERSSGVAPNLLCDGSSYLLGVDEKGKPDRAIKCFEGAKALHLDALSNCESSAAIAVRRFFEKWQPDEALDNSAVAAQRVAVLAAGNLAFIFEGREVLDDDAIRNLVESRALAIEDAQLMTSLISGVKGPVARLHPKIKGLMGAQSSGAVLVGFNAPSFTSYGRDDDQGLNAPITDYEAFAYTSALNYLISDAAHHVRVGDTTIVYWALDHDDECSWAIGEAINPGSSLRPPWEDDEIAYSGDVSEKPASILEAIMERVRSGKRVHEAKLDTPFFILGLSPNAARVSVRFFLESTFGDVLENLDRHYQRLQIAHGLRERPCLSPGRLVWEVENPNSRQTVAANMLVGALLRAILTDGRYPQALYQGALSRIRAMQDDDEKGTRKVDYGRAAIIRACLIKNYGVSEKELTVDLNKERDSVPYYLGRLFALMEEIQRRAAWVDGRKINSTIMDRYFDSACATPAVVFPVIEKLSMAHLGKLRKSGRGTSMEKMMGEINCKIHGMAPSYPSRLSLEEQGDFIIGYWCQRETFFGTSDEASHQEKEN